VVVGLERQTERGSLTSIGDFFFIGRPQHLTFELDRSSNSAFAEARVTLAPGVSAQLGVRRDKVEGIAAVTTPHLGLVWQLPGGTTVLKANVNEGFKPPSFFALGFPIGGNPDLRPERSKNAELTLVQRLAGLGSAQVTVFQTDYKDLVDFDGETFTNINRGRIVVKGVEPMLQLEVARRWRAQLSATLLNIDVRDGLQPLRNRPERRASAWLLHEFDTRSTLYASLNHTGGFLDRSNPTGDVDMTGFTTVDVGATVKLDALQLKLSVDNLLNKTYEPFVGFAAPGRRVRVALRADF
jgi:outer membrane receptor protein involved in Fe transport